MFSLRTASGTVRIAPSEPDDTGAVRYTLTSAVKGCMHAVATHNPSDWHEFNAVRVSLGAANHMEEMPAGLPRVRNGRRCYHGSIVRLATDDEPVWRPGGLGLRDTDDRDAPPRTGQTLDTVMRACADDYAARPDFSRLLATAKARETPKLRKWLADMIPDAERDMRRCQAEAEAHRRRARQVTAAWWQAARWCAVEPAPLLALVLAATRGSLADQVRHLPLWAEIADESAQFYRRRLEHYRAEEAGLRQHRHSSRPAVAAATP